MQRIEVKVAGKAVGYIRQLGGLWVAITYGRLYSPPMFGQKVPMLEYVKIHGHVRTTCHCGRKAIYRDNRALAFSTPNPSL